jgi:hypothetical protein
MAVDPAARFAVVIPCRDRPALLRECLEALSAQPEDLVGEVVVVDVGDASAIGDVIRNFPQTRHLAARAALRPGPARNLGAAATSEARIVFLDADCRPEPGWLYAAGNSLDAGAKVVGGAILDARPLHAIAAAAHFLQNAERGPGRPAQVAKELPGAHLAMRRATFEALGGFSNAPGEDVRFARAAASRWPGRVRFEPRMRVRHTGVASWRGFWTRHLQLGSDRAQTGPPPTVVRWLGASRPAAVVAGLARLGFLAACTLRWHPAGLPRLVLFSPVVAVGLVAWGLGYARASREARSRTTAEFRSDPPAGDSESR